MHDRGKRKFLRSRIELTDVSLHTGRLIFENVTNRRRKLYVILARMPDDSILALENENWDFSDKVADVQIGAELAQHRLDTIRRLSKTGPRKLRERLPDAKEFFLARLNSKSCPVYVYLNAFPRYRSGLDGSYGAYDKRRFFIPLTGRNMLKPKVCPYSPDEKGTYKREIDE